jgi:hypothetical protein
MRLMTKTRVNYSVCQPGTIEIILLAATRIAGAPPIDGERLQCGQGGGKLGQGDWEKLTSYSTITPVENGVLIV